MPALPLPFLAPILLAVVLVRLAFQRGQRNRRAILFICICTVTSTIDALRWGLHLETAKPLQLAFAALVPPAAWLCFSPLKEPRRWPWSWVLAIAAMFCLSAIWFPWNVVDLLLSPLYLGVGSALIALAWHGADGLSSLRLTEAIKAHRTLVCSGGALLASGGYNSVIAADFGLYGGVHVRGLVVGFELVTLPLLAYAAALVGPNMPPEHGEENAFATLGPGSGGEIAPDASDQQIMAVFEALMRQKSLFKDQDLTLNRLARRAGMPARSLSSAVNRVTGRNISQVVNEFRIAEAQRLLLETAMPVNTLMEQVGFRTKSNFNREFLRVTGASPSAFRQSSQTSPPAHSPVSTT